MTVPDFKPFPGERPNPTEKERWFKETERTADETEIGFLLRGEEAPSLIKYAHAKDMSDLNRIPLPEAAEPEKLMAAVKFNDYVDKAIAEELNRKECHAQGKIRLQRSWAAALAKSMRDTVPLLLKEAQYLWMGSPESNNRGG